MDACLISVMCIFVLVVAVVTNQHKQTADLYHGISCMRLEIFCPVTAHSDQVAGHTVYSTGIMDGKLSFMCQVSAFGGETRNRENQRTLSVRGL